MIYGEDFSIQQIPRHHKGSIKPKVSNKKQLNVESKAANLKPFNVEYRTMRNLYNCNLKTPEGMREYKRLYARQLRAKQKQNQEQLKKLLKTVLGDSQICP